MSIQVRGIPIGSTLRGHVAQRLDAVLVRLRTAPASTPILVTFFDDNGPKGGLAMRCAITIRLPYRPHLRAEEIARTSRLAFDGSMAKIERELERYRIRDRDSRRRPKKYYAAARVSETPPAAPAAPAARRRARRSAR